MKRTLAMTLSVVLSTGITFSSPANARTSLADLQADIQAVLAKLEQMQQQANENASKLNELQQELRVLDSNATPCTLDRFANNLCGADNQPFDMTIELCGNVGAEGSVGADFQINNTNNLTVGVGWDEGLDLNLARTIEFPGIPGIAVATANPGMVIFGAPFPNLQGGATAAGGLGIEGCIEVPVQINIDRDQALALMQEWQISAQQLQETILASAAERGMQPGKINEALVALQQFQSKAHSEVLDATLRDPLRIFDSGTALGQLVDALPVGDRVESILATPEQMVGAFKDAKPGRPNIVDICEALDDPNRPTLGAATSKACDTLLGLPNLGEIIDALEAIEGIPDAVALAVDDLNIGNVTGKTKKLPIKNTKPRACKLFPRLCN